MIRKLLININYIVYLIRYIYISYKNFIIIINIKYFSLYGIVFYFLLSSYISDFNEQIKATPLLIQ